MIFRGGWTGHDPVQTTDHVTSELRKRGADVTVFDDQEELVRPGLADKYDVIIPAWTMGALIDGASNALREAVKSGVGLAGWHGGMGDAFRNDCDYQFMCGGQWVAHPGNGIDYRVNIVSDDSIVAGITDFDIHSEQYYLHVDPSNEVLATTTFNGEHCAWIDGTVMPVVWKRKWGSGKVFYCSLGHNYNDFLNVPQITEIIVRGVFWAAK